MAETLEVSTFGYKLNKEDQQILHSLETGELVLEQVVSLADVEQSKALSSITRLIAVGYLRLVIIPHIWGVEFVLQPTGGITAPQESKIKNNRGTKSGVHDNES